MGDRKHDDPDDFVIRRNYDHDEAEELRREDYYERPTSVFRERSATPYFIGGIGIIVLVVLFIVFLSRPRNAVTIDQLQSIEARIQQLENRLAKMDNIEQHLIRLEKQERESSLLTERFNQFESTIATQIDQIIKELDKLYQKTAKEPLQKARPSPPAETVTRPKETKPKLHQVLAGETLYGISRSYGLTVDQLRKYNNIGANASIYPGQKLKLTPNGDN